VGPFSAARCWRHLVNGGGDTLSAHQLRIERSGSRLFFQNSVSVSTVVLVL